MTRCVLALVLAAGLTGCATGIYTTGTRPSETPSEDDRGGEGAALPAEQPQTRSPSAAATNALLAQSRTERFAGDLGAAAATLERALAIAPDDALLWVELAEVRFDQGDRSEAQALARKALTLTAVDSAMARRARQIIER